MAKQKILSRRQILANESRELFFFGRTLNRMRGLSFGNTQSNKSVKKTKSKNSKRSVEESGLGIGENREIHQESTKSEEKIS